MTQPHFPLDDSPQFRMVELDETTSTNDFLSHFRPVGPERRLTLVTAEHQTAGRGAGHNRWESEPGKNLLFSLMVHPRHIRPDRIFLLSEVLSLAICEAVGLPLSVKWPNDIYWGNRKLCGMLVENEMRGQLVERSIMGVGINVNQTEFAFDRSRLDGLRRMAEPVSLAQIMGHPLERRFLLEGVVEHFLRYYAWTEQGRQDELHQMYLSRLYRKDEVHGFVDAEGPFRGTITDVEPGGRLVIIDEAGQSRRYGFKEVEYKIKN